MFSRSKTLLFNNIKKSNLLMFNLNKSFAIKFSKNPLITADQAYLDFKSKDKITKFVDVRDTEAFIKSHVTGAQNMNEIFTYLSTSDQSGIDAMKNEFTKVFQANGINGNEQIILYEECLKTRFGASCRGLYLFNLFGFYNVSVLHGAWESWVQKGLPVSSEIEKISEKGTFSPSWNGSIFANKQDVIDAVGNKDVVLLDVRDFDEWKGESSSPYGVDYAPKKGRIPGAIHIFWKDFMYEENGMTFMKSPSDILKVTQAKGIKPEQNVIIYCFKGARASNSFIALNTAGFKNIRNYFASWNEWSRDPDCPVDETKI
jgi:thiosulfate/3-mercaptopyruvate sulfurtransferase